MRARLRSVHDFGCPSMSNTQAEVDDHWVSCRPTVARSTDSISRALPNKMVSPFLSAPLLSPENLYLVVRCPHLAEVRLRSRSLDRRRLFRLLMFAIRELILFGRTGE